MTPILELQGVSAGYVEEAIVRDLSILFPTGTITTLIGPNGAGKSTVLRTIYGQTRMISGRVLLDGRDIDRATPAERLGIGVGFVPQGRCNFPHMTVAENLELAGWSLARGVRAEARARVLDQFPVLRTRLSVLAGNLSGGEQQILEMAMVLEARPRLMLLDEPSLGLSPINQGHVFETIANIRNEGVTVIMVEQNTQGALAVSDTAVVLELGQLFMQGTAREVLNDARVRTAYLGAD